MSIMIPPYIGLNGAVEVIISHPIQVSDIQGNLSMVDTLGTAKSVLISEVSTFLG